MIDRLEAVKRTGPNAWTARCPAHDDRIASLSIALTSEGKWLLFCHSGCSYEQIAAALQLDREPRSPEPHTPGLVRVPALGRAPSRPSVEPAACPVSEDDVARWAVRLQASDELLERIHAVKGWTTSTLFRLGIGWDGRRLTLPVRAPGGLLRGVLRYLPGGEPKMLATRGAGRDLWPPPEQYPQGCIVWLVEGEPDAVSVSELGYFAVAIPGAARWLDDWTRRLAEHLVVIVADCDRPGRQAARRAVDELHRHCEVRYVDLDATRCDGHDIGDELLAATAQGDLGVRRLKHALEEAAGFREKRAA